MLINKTRLSAIALSLIIFASLMPFRTAKAEEGMFTMDKVASLPLAKKGLKINPAKIYDPVKGGLSEAVPRLSIGCSSEFVSPDGLILTNHHCGFDALVAASTQAKNYGEEGYRAGSRAEELPAKGYSIDITLKEEDVTSRILTGINADDADAVRKRVQDVQKEDQAKAGADLR